MRVQVATAGDAVLERDDRAVGHLCDRNRVFSFFFWDKIRFWLQKKNKIKEIEKTEERSSEPTDLGAWWRC